MTDLTDALGWLEREGGGRLKKPADFARARTYAARENTRRDDRGRPLVAVSRDEME